MRRALLPLGQMTADQLAGTVAVDQTTGCVAWTSVYETSGTAAATFELHDGPVGNGQRLATIELAAGASYNDDNYLHALSFVLGLYVYVVKGAVGGNLLVWGDHYCERWLEEEHVYYRTLEQAIRSAGLAGGG